ncbi:MAG TPA: response regulator [Gemmataceae bacterium]|nr:response regulator [Gemmataceae bacterium]
MPERAARVLVVDSEPKVLGTVSSLLRQEGHQVETAKALGAALRDCAANPPDVLLTELSVPEMDLLSEVRRVWPGTVCVLLTGYATIESAVAAMRRGAYDYLVKPCVVEHLKQTVARAIEHGQASLLAAEHERRLRQLNDELEERVKARTAELARANDRLAEANAAKDRFLATLSHELRTPLTPLRAAIDLLKLRHQSDATVGPVLESMESSLNQETRLIDDLLDMARINTGKLALHREAVDLPACLRAAAAALRPRAEAKGQTLDVTLDSFPLLLADPVRLRQVASNLLDNAIKFTPECGRVALEARREGSRAVLRVSDTGPGIAASFLPHVFEPFRQADSSSRRQHGGLGLGLSIVRTIAELHGGHAQAVNLAPRGGASFSVTFPIVPAPAPAPAPPSVDLGPLRVLLVDDSADTVAVLSRLLEAKGLQVRQAVRVSQALALARADPPDVIITDIGMPEQDGYDLLNLLRADPRLREVPVIAATGYVGSSEQTRMAEMGFAAALSKPFELDELLRALAQVRRG